VTRTSLPGFTADPSFYRMKAYYQSSRNANTSATLTGGIYPELARQGGEVINVEGCSPGFLQLGEGSSMTCIPDPTLPGGGGDIGVGGSGSNNFRPTQGGKCHASTSTGHLVNEGTYDATRSGWRCCSAKTSDGKQLCLPCEGLGSCENGYKEK
jgi:hypothetical protein